MAPAGLGPRVVLVGPMGSGKSTVGSMLARRLELAFRDTDADVVERVGKPIPDIFTDDGEQHFRALETEALRAALAEHEGILALGGGAVLAEENQALLRGHPVVFLSLSVQNGVRRTGLGQGRPLLAGINPRATYRALLEARLPIYRAVSVLEVDTDHRSPSQVATEIIEKLHLQESSHE